MKKSLASNDETIWHLVAGFGLRYGTLQEFSTEYRGHFGASALKNNILRYKTYVLITQRPGVRIPPAVDEHLQ